MSDFLNGEGFSVTALSSGHEAIALVRQDVIQFSVALIDYHMPELSGEETILGLKKYNPDLSVYAFSGDESVDAFQKSLQSGATFFIQKDISNEKLLGLLRRACVDIESKTKIAVLNEYATENEVLISKIDMVGVSDHLAQVARTVLKLAPYSDAVLIRGENGTGKDKVARAVHRHSNYSQGPFIAVNCGAIPESLIESEFFGYVKGAFTGADKNKKGLVEAADGGTLFLDEIGELPKHLQSKLLRVLQDKTITPVGSTDSIKVNFRLVCATNALLEAKIRLGDFREDLFYRINVLPIDLKPLREHAEDIPALALHFLHQFNIENKQNKKILKTSMEQLKRLHWQGNVRELQQAIKYMTAISVTDNINVDPFVRSGSSKQVKVFDQLAVLKVNASTEESSIIQRALVEGGSVSAASRLLNMSRSTFRDKIKKYKIALDHLR